MQTVPEKALLELRKTVQIKAEMSTLFFLMVRVIVIKSNCCWMEGPTIMFLQALKMQQSFAEGALQPSNSFMDGVGDSVHINENMTKVLLSFTTCTG